MRYRGEDIENLISQLRIEEVVGEVVELRKSGANYKGLCPFHSDTSPSFTVSPAKNICKCFVCGAGGNPVKFYSNYHKLSFEEAVGELSKKYSIPIKAYSRNVERENKDEKYHKIMEAAHKYFQDNIFENVGREALEYLSKREVTPKIIRENNLGYAINDWSGLYDFLVGEGYEKKYILELGLAKEGEKGVYDTFRNRVIFPIYSISGRVIGFGGRSLENTKEIPKYINSSDTPIFKKGRNLYGIKDKGNVLKKKNYSLLMEGYMDVLSAHSYGFDVAIASLGTAFTLEQGELLKRYTNNVIISFDMDSAGQAATEKTALILKNLGFNIRVLKLQNAKDPDEYLKTFGKEGFLNAVKNSLEIFDFLYEMYSREYDLSNIISKENFLIRFKEFFRNIESSLEKNLYLDKLSKYTDINKDVLQEILIDKNKYEKIEIKKTEYIKNKKEKSLGLSKLEEETLELIFSDINYYNYFSDKNINSSFIKRMFYYFEDVKEKEDKEKEFNNFMKREDFSQEERDRIYILKLRAFEYVDNKKRQDTLKEVFKSWFVKEIQETAKELKSRKIEPQHLIMGLELKKIEKSLSTEEGFEEILEKYKKFRGILSANDVL